MRPVQVYLDSSDYSDFGKALAGRGTSANLELAHRLRTLADSGRVEFRFSIVHVVEAAPTGVQYVDYARERGLAIEYLSRSSVLEPWQRLPALELMARLSGDTATPPRNRLQYHARNDSGHWFPPFESALAEIRRDVETRLRDPLAAVIGDSDIPLTREVRRKIDRKRKSGRPREAILRDLSSQWPTWLPRLRALIPVSKQHEALWLQYFKGKAKIEDVSNALRNDLSDITEVMAWLAPTITSGLSELPKWLRGSGERLMQLYAQYRGPLEEKMRDLERYVPRPQLEKFWEEESPFGKRIADPNWLNEAIATLVQMDRLAIEKSGHSLEAALMALKEHGNTALPSMATYSALTSFNLQKSLSPFERGRSAEKIRSDVGDIFHAVYMPYVDVMRIDGFAEQYMRPVGERWNTTLVARRHDLPKAIEQVLSGWRDDAPEPPFT